MAHREEFADIMVGLRYISRMARRLSKVPDERLRLDMEDALDAGYMNECLDIVCCRICGLPEVSMPPLGDAPAAGRFYRWCMGKAARQAGRLLWGIWLGRIGKCRLNHDAWCNIDSAGVHMRELASCEVKRKGRYLWFFRRKRL